MEGTTTLHTLPQPTLLTPPPTLPPPTPPPTRTPPTLLTPPPPTPAHDDDEHHPTPPPEAEATPPDAGTIIMEHKVQQWLHQQQYLSVGEVEEIMHEELLRWETRGGGERERGGHEDEEREGEEWSGGEAGGGLALDEDSAGGGLDVEELGVEGVDTDGLMLPPALGRGLSGSWRKEEESGGRDKPLPTLPFRLARRPSTLRSVPAMPGDDKPLLLLPSPLAPSPLIQASPLPPSAPPTRRSRAGSLGASMSLSLTSLASLSPISPYSTLAPNAIPPASAAAHSHTPSVGSVGIRDAVYIDSEEVRARLDALLMGLADGQNENTPPLPEDAKAGVGEGEYADEDAAEYYHSAMPFIHPPRASSSSSSSSSSAGEYYHYDYDVDPDAANALRTPPPPPPGLAGLAWASASEASAAVHHRHTHNAQQRSMASLRSAGSFPPGSLSSSASPRHSQPYQSAQASASQVYIGPLPPISRSPSSSAHPASGAYTHPRSQSKGPSLSRRPSQLHSRMPSAAGTGHSRSASGSAAVAVGGGISAAPMRPPPAPPLDVGGLDIVDVVAGDSGVDAESYVRAGRGGQGQGEADEDEQAVSDGERERLQLLHDVGLGDRIEGFGFGGVVFPSASPAGLGDDGDDNLDRDDERFYDKQQHTYEARDVPSTPPAMQSSMSRWSVGSSLDEPTEDTNAGSAAGVGDGSGKKEKERRKRKSFVSGFRAEGGGGAALTASPTGGKKRGRLASFISRLSGVGGAGMNGNALAGTAGLPPTPAPLPSSSPLHPPRRRGLQPSLQIGDGDGIRKMRSEESVGGHGHVQVHGVVSGTWAQPLPATANSYHSGSTASGSVSGSAMPRLSVHAGKRSPPQEGSAGERKSGMNSGLRARANTSADLLLLADRSRRPSDPVLYKSASASVLGPAARVVQRMPRGQGRRPPRPIRTGTGMGSYTYLGAPTVVVVDGSLPPTPSSMASSEIEEWEGEEAAYDDEEEEEDYGVEMGEQSRLRREQAHEERWAAARLKNQMVSEARQQQPLPPIPQSPPPPPPPTASSSGAGGVLMGPSSTSYAMPHPQSQSQNLVPKAADGRQRLKSMPSFPSASAGGAAATAPPGSASTANFSLITPPPPLPLLLTASSGPARAGKNTGFRGFVDRLLVGTSSAHHSAGNSTPSNANTSPTNSPVSASYPGPPLQLLIPGSSTAVLGQFNSAHGGGSRSLSHSPTTSLTNGNGNGMHKGSGVFTPGGLLGKKKPKRKLVISGISPDNVRAYEAVRRWCEGLGEVREITRASNGNVYVDFKKASVADTVCCIQAQVFIKGAGSVSLSYDTKRKPL